MQPYQSQDDYKYQQLPTQLLDLLDGVYCEAVSETRNFTFLAGNDSVLLGYPRARWYEDNFWANHLHPDDRARVLQSYVHALSTRESHRFDYRMLAADGRTVWIQDRISVIESDGGIGKVCGLLQDISDKKQTEIALQETQMRLDHASDMLMLVDDSSRIVDVNKTSCATDITELQKSQRDLTDNYKLMLAIVNGSSDVIYAKDLDGHYLLINTAGADLFGLRVEDVLCRRDSELPATQAARILLQSSHSHSRSNTTPLVEQEAVVAGKHCTFLSTYFSYSNAEGEELGTIGISRDVTELKQLGDALRHSQKMEAVGRLAGGIAHDFNNLLTVILSYSELLQLSLPEGDPQLHQVNEIFKSGQRAAGLTRQLLAFSRKQELHPKTFNIRQSLNDLTTLLQPIVGENIELSIDVAAEVADVKMDLEQFRQSILNLAANARDAMPHGGRISIVVDDFRIQTPDQVVVHPHLKFDRYARISFSDTGIGMSESTQARIFEPFFTTKQIGKGTGLGLSMTYGFMTQSGGHIEVSSICGHGSTFRLYLPCVSSDLLELAPSPRADEFDTTSLSPTIGKETVLLVEDEETVRVLCCRILEACGYTVLKAQDGIEAQALLQSSTRKIDLLITDVVMPRMNGPKLVESVYRELPLLPVLFISGYADDVILRDIPDTKRNLLRKPFSPKQLVDRVRATLDEAAKLSSNG